MFLLRSVIFQTCLNSGNSLHYQFVLVMGLLQIINQEKISWWPSITIVYSRAADLRKMFTDTMQSVNQMWTLTRTAQPPVSVSNAAVLEPLEYPLTSSSVMSMFIGFVFATALWEVLCAVILNATFTNFRKHKN